MKNLDKDLSLINTRQHPEMKGPDRIHRKYFSIIFKVSPEAIYFDATIAYDGSYQDGEFKAEKIGFHVQVRSLVLPRKQNGRSALRVANP